MEVFITSKIMRQISDLDKVLEEEVHEKIDLFKDVKNHKSLKVHKLHGKLKGYYSFSVNYKYRIVFKYINKKAVALLTIGDHDIYKQ